MKFGDDRKWLSWQIILVIGLAFYGALGLFSFMLWIADVTS